MEDKVNLFLNADTELNRYIEKGTSEIHWNNKKVIHFELIKNLLQSAYKDAVINIISIVLKKFEVEKLVKIVQLINREVPDVLAYYKIPDNRKQLIIKMITLRLEKLRTLTNERI